METRYLEQLIAIEENKSMREAAEKLYLSQAALSHNVKKLEEEFGCELFDRSRNHMEMNSCGQILLEHARSITAEIDKAKEEIAEEKRRLSLRIKVGIYAYAFQAFVMPNIANAVKDEVFECSIKDRRILESGLLEGEYDCIFTDKPINQEGVVSTRLFKEQVMVSMPPTSELASKQNLYLSDLEKLDIMLVDNASGYTDWFEEILGEAEITIPKENRISFKEYLYEKDRVGKAHITGSFILRFLPAAARRVIVPLAEDIAFRSIYMVYKKSNMAKLEKMIDFMQENDDALFTGTSFLPFFLFPETGSNLVTE